MKIAVVGSINIDQSVETDRIPRKGETIAGQSLQYTPGGKGANQAVAMGRLGAEVVFLAVSEMMRMEKQCLKIWNHKEYLQHISKR